MQREHHRPLSEGQVTRIEHDEFADSGTLFFSMESCEMKYKSLYFHYRIGIFKRKTLVGEGIYYMYAAPTHLQGVIITILMNIGYFLCQRKAPSGLVETKGKILLQRPQRIRQGP